MNNWDYEMRVDPIDPCDPGDKTWMATLRDKSAHDTESEGFGMTPTEAMIDAITGDSQKEGE